MKRRSFIREVCILSAAPMLWLPRAHAGWTPAQLRQAKPNAVGGGGGGSIALRNATAGAADVTQSPTVTYPTTANNDILVVFFVTQGGADISGTPPTGFTAIRAEVDGASETLRGFWKRADGTETSEEWTNIFAALERTVWTALSFSGCITTGSPIDSNTTGETSASGTAKDVAVTTTVDNAYVVGVVGFQNGTAAAYTWALDGGLDDLASPNVTPNPYNDTANCQMVVAGVIKATAGAQNIGGDLGTAATASETAFALLPA